MQKGTARGTGVLLVLLAFLSYGCGPMAMDREDLVASQREGRILAVHYPPAPFEAWSSGKQAAAIALGVPAGTLAYAGIFAILALPFLPPLLALQSAARSAGEEMAKDLSLEDPAVRVKDRFVSTLTTDLGFKSIQVIHGPLESDRVDKLKEAFGTGLVIDFKTKHWRLGPGLSYSARARFVRLEDSRVFWEGDCHTSEKGQDLSWDALLADKGARLKAGFDALAETCARQLSDPFRVRTDEPASPRGLEEGTAK